MTGNRADAASGSAPLRRIAVIGGGISGLAAAHRLIELSRQSGRRIELTLFEAGSRLGGVIETTRIGEYLVEAGPDSFITNKPWALDLCRRVGLEDRLLPTDQRYRRSFVLRRGKPVPVPDGFLLLAPARVWPVMTSPLFSLRGKLRMACEYFIPRRRYDADESLASFVRRRFGREALERLVQPLVGGIYTSDPERLSLQATMPQFLDMEKQHRSLIRASRVAGRRSRDGGQSNLQPSLFSGSRLSNQDPRPTESGARYGLFAAPAGGMQDLVEALVRAITVQSQTLPASTNERAECAAATIRLNTRIETIQRSASANGPGSSVEDAEPESAVVSGSSDHGRSCWILSLTGGETQRFDAVVVAVPAWCATELLRGVSEELARLLGGIQYASSAVVVSGHRLSDGSHPLDAFGLVVPAIEGRSILAVSISSRKFAGRAPEGRVILRTFLGGALQPEVLQQTDDELKNAVGRELQDIFGIRGPAEFATVARYHRAMPQYHVGHLARVSRIESCVAGITRLALAGNALHGVGIPDCIHSGEAAAEAVW